MQKTSEQYFYETKDHSFIEPFGTVKMIKFKNFFSKSIVFLIAKLTLLK